MQRTAVMDKDLKALSIKKKRWSTTVNDHPLRDFFMSRGILQSKLAEVCGLCEPHMSEMLRGIRVVPPAIEARLNELHTKITAWEERAGKIFGAESR